MRVEWESRTKECYIIELLTRRIHVRQTIIAALRILCSDLLIELEKPLKSPNSSPEDTSVCSPLPLSTRFATLLIYDS